MGSWQRALRLAQTTTPRYCDHCGSQNLWAQRGTVLGPDSNEISIRHRWTRMPSWECGVCFGLTVLTTRSAKRLAALDRKPRFQWKFRKVVINTRELVQ